VELTASDEEIHTEGMVQNQPGPNYPKIDAYGMTDSYPGIAVIPNQPERMTTSASPFVQVWSLDLQSERSYAS